MMKTVRGGNTADTTSSTSSDRQFKHYQRGMKSLKHNKYVRMDIFCPDLIESVEREK